ncbi:MAG: hypothetical protein SFZ24_00980 [Planctomycetota bacterium]|nr:hypothetical protein [Planctomycetota bacterium]
MFTRGLTTFRLRDLLIRTVVPLSGLAAGAVQASGQIVVDAAFGSGGIAVTGAPVLSESWKDLSVQPDGRIVAVGSRVTTGGAGGSNFLVARLLPTGAPDPSFNSSGTVELDFGAPRFDTATSVVILPDGRILVAGDSIGPGATVTTPVGTTFGRYSDVAIARFNSNGTLDTTFGSGGRVLVDLSSGLSDTTARLLVLPTGAIRVVGNYSTNPGNRIVNNWAIVGLTESGAVDPAFGAGGRTTINFPASTVLTSANDAILRGGQIIVTGTSGSELVAARLDASTGALDPAFGASGLAVIAFPPAPGSPMGVQTAGGTSLAAQADGGLLIVGNGVFFDFNLDQFGPTQLFAVRLGTTGQIDPSFNAFPSYQVDGEFARVRIVRGRAIISDGGPLVAGGRTTLYTLGDDGAFTASTGPLPSAFNALSTQADGRVLAAGRIGGDAAIVRVEIGGIAPPPCVGDANGSGAVGFDDVTSVLASFGDTTSAFGPGDANGDGAVNFADISSVLSRFNTVCP